MGQDGAMEARTAGWLAWSIGALTLAMFGAGVALALSRPPQLPEGMGIETLEVRLLEDVPFLVFAGLGVLIAARRPANPIGWMFAAIGSLLLFSSFAREYALYALHTNPGALPGGAALAWASTWPWLIGVGVFPLVILFFPDGRLPSRRWRVLLWLVIADTAVMAFAAAVLLWPARGLQLVTDLGEATVSPVAEGIIVIGFPLLLVTLPLAAASLLLRFRRARGDERQQLKWVAYGVGVGVASLAFSELDAALTGISVGPLFSVLVDAVGTLAVPVATGVAILRYHLYDIDFLINRTLVYGGLSVVLGLVYISGVFGVGGALRSIAGQENNSLAVAASTLAVAALFRPARARIQGFIDRRFYRHNYDAVQTLEAFSARLRGELNLEALTADLVAVVRDTMQPAHASVWLRIP